MSYKQNSNQATFISHKLAKDFLTKIGVNGYLDKKSKYKWTVSYYK